MPQCRRCNRQNPYRLCQSCERELNDPAVDCLKCGQPTVNGDLCENCSETSQQAREAVQ